MKTLRLHKFIAITLCVTLLTVSVSRVTRVSAIGTTATIAATAFVLTGAVYISYLALTQASIDIPASDHLHDWLGGIGKKVSQYPSGQEAYQDIYQGLLSDPTANVIDGVWTWTQDRLKAFANDFSDTRLIQNIVSFTRENDVSQIPTNGFTYPFEIVAIPNVIYYNGLHSFSDYMGGNYSVITPSGPMVMLNNLSLTRGSAVYSDFSLPVRNLQDGARYYAQYYENGEWRSFSQTPVNLYLTLDNGFNSVTIGPNNDSLDFYTVGALSKFLSGWFSFPVFPHEVIHDMATDEDLPMVDVESTEVVRTPQWLDPDNENRPIIPWVPIPDIPTGTPVPPGYTGPPQWGFPLQDLLDLLEALSEALVEIGLIGHLINEFAGQHGDIYYLEYNDGDTNYYQYYQPTVFDNDTEYVTYNIDVSDTEEHLPVDLNTIELYTNNRYLDEVKRSALAGGSIIRDLVVFWYDVDPLIVYVFFGSCIAILVAAFIGKWGHS